MLRGLLNIIIKPWCNKDIFAAGLFGNRGLKAYNILGIELWQLNTSQPSSVYRAFIKCTSITAGRKMRSKHECSFGHFCCWTFCLDDRRSCLLQHIVVIIIIIIIIVIVVVVVVIQNVFTYCEWCWTWHCCASDQQYPSLNDSVWWHVTVRCNWNICGDVTNSWVKRRENNIGETNILSLVIIFVCFI